MRRALTSTLTVMGSVLVTVAAAGPALAEQDITVTVGNTSFAHEKKKAVPVEFTARLSTEQTWTFGGWKDDIVNWGDCPREHRRYELAAQQGMTLCTFVLDGSVVAAKVADIDLIGAYLHPNGEKESFEALVQFDNNPLNFGIWGSGDAIRVDRSRQSGYQHTASVSIQPPTPRPMPQLQTLLASQPCTITGTPGDDVLLGTKGDDVICGFDGDDLIVGFGGDDVLVGGDGDDILHGGGGDDLLYGGAGNDRADGGAGDDQMVGGLGEDLLIGGGGDDSLRGGSGDDALLADAERSIIVQDGENWMTTDGGANILETHDGEPAAWMAPADRQLPKDPFEPTRGCVFSIARPYAGGGSDCLDNAYAPVGGPIIVENPAGASKCSYDVTLAEFLACRADEREALGGSTHVG